MGNPKRSWKDIKNLKILTEVQGIHGWVIDMVYKDYKAITLQVDYGKSNEDMLRLTFDAIKKQLEGTDE